MIDEFTAFLRSIADEPKEDARRLAFADWLEEHDEPGAGFVRAAVRGEPHAHLAQPRWRTPSRLRWTFACDRGTPVAAWHWTEVDWPAMEEGVHALPTLVRLYVNVNDPVRRPGLGWSMCYHPAVGRATFRRMVHTTPLYGAVPIVLGAVQHLLYPDYGDACTAQAEAVVWTVRRGEGRG